MSVTLPTAREWMDAQLKRVGLTQNELGRRIGISSSAMSCFARGIAGPQTCLNVAQSLNVSPLFTLALCGHIPAPASWKQGDFETLAIVWDALDNTRRDNLLSYAQYMLERQSDTG